MLVVSTKLPDDVGMARFETREKVLFLPIDVRSQTPVYSPKDFEDRGPVGSFDGVR
jgi:hypothetical protein